MQDLITPNMDIRVVIFDFGGVIADEGFKLGLRSLARSSGLDEADLEAKVRNLIYASGYINGQISEADFWRQVREGTGLRTSDSEMREAILSRFVIRPHMLSCVEQLRSGGRQVVILSDQTNWLDELNERDGFFGKFDVVLNSYYLGINKRDPEIFVAVRNGLFVYPQQILFVDDDAGNTERARAKGLNVIHYTGRQAFAMQIAALGVRDRAQKQASLLL